MAAVPGAKPAGEADQDLKLVLAQKKFLLKSPGLSETSKAKLQEEVLDVIFKDDLAPIYEYFCQELGWTVDASKLSAMQAKNLARVEELDAKVKDAVENLGEAEVRDGLLAKAEYYAQLGDRNAATKAYTATEAKTAGGGNKLDLVFSQIRLNILYEDWNAVKALLARGKALSDQGGDWERKNKLKVYEAVFSSYTRDFTRAAELFLDSIATFTTSELFPYPRVIFYAVVTSMVSLDRVALKKRVIDSPEILSVIGQVPALSQYINSLYGCKYKEFFQAFVEVIDQMKSDMYLAPHIRYYMREIRVVAYSQFLESYKSVTMESMAGAFDVSVSFLDSEVADLIVAGRLNAKIDKVAGIIETNRPDAKNALYQDSIKKGDLLLNRIQKLSKVIDVE